MKTLIIVFTLLMAGSALAEESGVSKFIDQKIPGVDRITVFKNGKYFSKFNCMWLDGEYICSRPNRTLKSVVHDNTGGMDRLSRQTADKVSEPDCRWEIQSMLWPTPPDEQSGFVEIKKGWEPFAIYVVPNKPETYIWLRRRVCKD